MNNLGQFFFCFLLLRFEAEVFLIKRFPSFRLSSTFLLVTARWLPIWFACRALRSCARKKNGKMRWGNRINYDNLTVYFQFLQRLFSPFLILIQLIMENKGVEGGRTLSGNFEIYHSQKPFSHVSTRSLFQFTSCFSSFTGSLHCWLYDNAAVEQLFQFSTLTCVSNLNDGK